MNNLTASHRSLAAAGLLSAFLFSACHSYHIDATIENRTGTPIQLLEVDYPNASFGADSLAAGADLHYRFQVHGSGPIKISYTAANGKAVQIAGPTLVEQQQGGFLIVLEPSSKVEFQAPPLPIFRD